MTIPAGFTSETANNIHYVRGGEGPTLGLIHRFPQDWDEWRRVMPRLAERFPVIAVALRGAGGSTPIPGGYDAATMAEDIHGLVDGPVHVVGHDIGGWVAYAYARTFPTRTAMLLETAVPGIEPWLELDLDVPMWHGEFHMVPGLPESLVADRQATYFRYFFDVGTIDHTVIGDEDVEHYASAYGDAERLRSAFEVYRAIPANMAHNTARTEPVDVP